MNVLRNTITIIISKITGCLDIIIVCRLLSLIISLNGYFILQKQDSIFQSFTP